MAISLDAALEKACVQILDTRVLVRVVLSGRRKSMETEFERVDIRPVLIKDKIQLQLSHNGGRATTVKNIAPQSDLILNLLNSGYSNILVEHTEGSMKIRITKSGDAQVGYEKKTFKQELSHDKKKSDY